MEEVTLPRPAVAGRLCCHDTPLSPRTQWVRSVIHGVHWTRPFVEEVGSYQVVPVRFLAFGSTRPASSA